MSATPTAPASVATWRRWLAFGRKKRVNQPVNAIADPDLRARRFLALAVASSQAANVTSVNTPILIAGALTLLLAVIVRQPPRNFVWRTLLMLATVPAMEPR